MTTPNESMHQINQYPMNYEEIDLREYLNVIGKWKYTIIGATILAMLVSGVLSFFVISPTYEVSTLVMVSQAQPPKNTPDSNIEGAINKLAELAQMNIASYAQQVKTPIVLQRTAERLNKPDRMFSIDELSQRVQAENIKGTDLIKITVTGQDPKEITDIANTLREEFIQYQKDINNQKLGRSVEMLDKQIKEEEAQLQEATERLKQFQMQSRSVDFLNKELNGRINQLVNLQSSLEQAEIEKEKLMSAINQHRVNLEKTPPTISRDITLDKVLNQEKGAINAEEVNDVYISISKAYNQDLAKLASCEAEISKTRLMINQLEAQIKDLQAELTEKQTEQNRLQNEVQLRQKAVDLLVAKRLEAQIIRSTNLSEANIVTASPAVIPESPVKPKKMLNIAIAGVLGLMLSVFGVFFVEYMKKEANPGSLLD